MTYIYDWDETKPAGSRALNLGDDDIREFKSAIRERLQGGGMYFPSTDDDDAGLFNWVKFIEQSSDPTNAANRGFLYTKEVNSITELFWMDSAGTTLQLTSNGKFDISNLVISSEARGDIIKRGASAWERLGIGSNGDVLTSDGTDPSWEAPAANPITTGHYSMWGGPIADIPSGWLHCDGSAKSRTTYADLFAIIGTIYGSGDGSTTFNLPDSRDLFLIGTKQDDSGAAKTNILGSLAVTGGDTNQPPKTESDSGGNPATAGGNQSSHSGHKHDIKLPFLGITLIIKT